jgi:hypothetical protein
MERQICLALIGSLLLVGGPAFAKGKPAKESQTSGRSEREAKEREARKACLEGDPAKGSAILSELFVDTKDRTYIFNGGRCFEQSERYPEAISRFREYLRTGPDPDDAALARKHIAECEELEAKRTPPVVVPPVAQPTPLPVAENAEHQSAMPQPSHERPTRSGSGLRTAGIVTAAFGAAGLLTGIALNLKANSLAKEIEPPNAYDASKESTRKSYETFSWIGYGVGAAAIATGAILYGVGLSRASSDKVAFVPAVGPGLAGLTLRGTF